MLNVAVKRDFLKSYSTSSMHLIVTKKVYKNVNFQGWRSNAPNVQLEPILLCKHGATAAGYFERKIVLVWYILNMNSWKNARVGAGEPQPFGSPHSARAFAGAPRALSSFRGFPGLRSRIFRVARVLPPLLEYRSLDPHFNSYCILYLD